MALSKARFSRTSLRFAAESLWETPQGRKNKNTKKKTFSKDQLSRTSLTSADESRPTQSIMYVPLTGK